MSDLVHLADQLNGHSGPIVLVTLFEVSGSTYRRTGARLLITDFGIHGLMSGGCLESEIKRQCSPILEGEARYLPLSIDTRQYLGCDGRLELWCELVEPELLERARQVTITRIPAYCHTYPHSEKPTKISNQAVESAFTEELLPPRRLFVFGSAPDSRPLVDLGRAMRWQTEQLVLSSDPVAGSDPTWKVLATAKQTVKLRVDETTACVIMNHHYGRDLELLKSLWNSKTPFLGLLGSRRRRDQLLEELAFGQGVDLESRHLYAPVGIDLGAEGPQEIALEICAQIQKVLATSDS